MRPTYRAHPLGESILTGITSAMVSATGAQGSLHTSSLLSTPTSRAIPRILKQSPRLGVRSTSIIASSKSRYLTKSTPTLASEGNSHNPLASSPRPSSSCAQSIPKDSTPRSLAFLILKLPGKTAPTVANGTLIPTRALGAPHTT